MTDNFSPLTRRILALGILILVLLFALRAGAALAGWTAGSIEALEDSRFRLARIEALRTRPAPPPLPPLPVGSGFNGRDHRSATEALGATVTAAAAAAGLALTEIAAEPQQAGNPRLVALRLAAAGPESAVLDFVARVEASSPTVRLVSWTIERAGGEAEPLRLVAVAAGAWSQP